MPRPTAPHRDDRPLSIDRLKRAARRQHREQSRDPAVLSRPALTLMQIQTALARQAGFQSWHHAVGCLPSRDAAPIREEVPVPDGRWCPQDPDAALKAFSPRQRRRIEAAMGRPGSMVVIDGAPGDGQKFDLYGLVHGLALDRLKVYVWTDAHQEMLAALGPNVSVITTQDVPDALVLEHRLRRADPDVVVLGNLNDPDRWALACRCQDQGVQVLGYANLPTGWPLDRQGPGRTVVRPLRSPKTVARGPRVR